MDLNRVALVHSIGPMSLYDVCVCVCCCLRCSAPPLSTAPHRLAAMHVSVQPEQWGAGTIQGQASLGLNCAAARRRVPMSGHHRRQTPTPHGAALIWARPWWFGGFDRVVLLVTGRGLLLDEERCRPLGVCQSDTAGLLASRWRSFLGHRSASPRSKVWRSSRTSGTAGRDQDVWGNPPPLPYSPASLQAI